MTEDVIRGLLDLLKRHVCTLKKASRDDTNHQEMCRSQLKVVDFDKIPNEYARGKGWRGVPKSNDALYISPEEKWYFIEFKNGSINSGEIYRKLYDSLIMLLELKILPDFEYIRRYIQYILVYNSEKQERIPPSEGRDETYGYFLNRAKTEKKLFGIEKLEQYLFSETHTYSKADFENNFVKVMEETENQAGE